MSYNNSSTEQLRVAKKRYATSWRKREAGQAMLLVLAVIVILTVLPVIVFSGSSQTASIAASQQNYNAALSAARAGLTDYENQLNQNLSFAAFNDVSQYAGASSDNAFNYAPGQGPAETATPFSCTGPYTTINAGRVANWQPVAGTSAPSCEHYTYAVDAHNASQGVISVTVTGVAGNGFNFQRQSERAVTTTLANPALSYVYNTNYNATNPAHATLATDLTSFYSILSFFGAVPSDVSSGNIQQAVDYACTKYAGQQWQVAGFTITGPFPGCPVDTFQGGWVWNGAIGGNSFYQFHDTVNGSIHSNDGLYYCGGPPSLFHQINYVNLLMDAIGAFTGNWGAIITAAIYGILFAGFQVLSGGQQEFANINGSVTAGVPSSAGGGGQPVSTPPGLGRFGGLATTLGGILSTLTGFPSCPSQQPNYSSGPPKLGKTLQPLPQPNPNLPIVASQGQAGPPTNGNAGVPASAGGCLYQGQTVIQFHQMGTMTVWSPDSRSMDSTGRNGCPSNGGTASLPSNGVIYVQNLQSGGCQPFPNPPFNALNYGYGTSQEQPIQNQSCNLGDAIIQGTVNGQLTVAAQNDVIITGSIYYGGTGCPGKGSTAVASSTCKSVLGLTAEGNVEVNHPQNQNLNTALTIINDINTACSVINTIATVVGIVSAIVSAGISIGGVALIMSICTTVTTVASLYLLFAIGRIGNDCPNTGYNACSNYSTADGVSDDDTTNPNSFWPDPAEPTWWVFDNPIDMLFQDFPDATEDLVFCGECTVNVSFSYPCSVNDWGFSLNWCNAIITLFAESWTDNPVFDPLCTVALVAGYGCESDNPQMNGGTYNIGALFQSDNDGDEWTIPDLLNVQGTIDWAWDGVEHWMDPVTDWLAPDTNFPAFYGSLHGSSSQHAVINADILAVGPPPTHVAGPGAVPDGSSPSGPLYWNCPSWNANCGMFKVNNSQVGMHMGTLHVNGAIASFYGGRVTGQCQSLQNLTEEIGFSTATSGNPFPYLACITNSGYTKDYNYDSRLIFQQPPYFLGGNSASSWSANLWHATGFAQVKSKVIIP